MDIFLVSRDHMIWSRIYNFLVSRINICWDMLDASFSGMTSRCCTESCISMLWAPESLPLRIFRIWGHCIILGNTQVTDSDITVRQGNIANTLIRQLRSGKILLNYSVEPFYFRCLDELVSLQKQKLLVATLTSANQWPLLKLQWPITYCPLVDQKDHM